MIVLQPFRRMNMAVSLFRRASQGLFLSALLVLGVCRAEDAVPAPINIDSNDVAAFLAVPDLKALLNTIDGLAQKVLPPEQYKPGMILAELAKNANDPGLASLQNKPIVAIAFKIPAGYKPEDGPPPMALYVPLNADSPILDIVKEGLKDNNEAQGAYEDGLLIIAPPHAMERAKSAKKLYM